jgi:hypothetical protein
MLANLKKYGKYVPHFTLGVLCHFAYDAKLKYELPFWDRFPLVIPADFQLNGNLLGYNLHYVPYAMRKSILDQLWKHMDYDPRARLQANYYFLKSLGLIEMLKPCIKSYIPGNIQSRILEIDPVNWYTVAKIPSASWQKGSPYKNAK